MMKQQEAEWETGDKKMIEEEKMKDKRGLNTCAKCGCKLSHTTFRDESGEMVGYIIECLKCDIVYAEE